MKMTIKELFENIEYETGMKFDENKFNNLFEAQDNKNGILEYGSDEQIDFIEKFLG